MRLSRSDCVADLPATDARELMRRFGDVQPESLIGSRIDTGSRTGAEVARAFADDGYLTVYDVDRDGVTWWESTVKGSALAQASFGRPITRANAERLLAGVIERARGFNADKSHLIEINELVVFGSYLDPARNALETSISVSPSAAGSLAPPRPLTRGRSCLATPRPPGALPTTCSPRCPGRRQRR